MQSLRPSQKEIVARMSSFNYSGFSGRLSSNVTRYSQSFVGRDFKVWAQMAPFILQPYLSPPQMELWIALSDVRYVYIYIYNLHCIYIYI